MTSLAIRSAAILSPIFFLPPVSPLYSPPGVSVQQGPTWPRISDRRQWGKFFNQRNELVFDHLGLRMSKYPVMVNGKVFTSSSPLSNP
jgi:hypothetical protein